MKNILFFILLVSPSGCLIFFCRRYSTYSSVRTGSLRTAHLLRPTIKNNKDSRQHQQRQNRSILAQEPSREPTTIQRPWCQSTFHELLYCCWSLSHYVSWNQWRQVIIGGAPPFRHAGHRPPPWLVQVVARNRSQSSSRQCPLMTTRRMKKLHWEQHEKRRRRIPLYWMMVVAALAFSKHSCGATVGLACSAFAGDFRDNSTLESESEKSTTSWCGREGIASNKTPPGTRFGSKSKEPQ